jgi:6-pyruvoyltetrahydropterin/6-carboxytetrahydropterin synthase
LWFLVSGSLSAVTPWDSKRKEYAKAAEEQCGAPDEPETGNHKPETPLFLRKFVDRMVYLTRVEHFNAAHKLYNPEWSREKNEEVFGKCANENWHGHNYELYVTVKGNPDPGTGFVFDVKKLSLLIKEHVTEKVDHRNLNVDVDFLKGKLCSTENLAIGIWNQLLPHLPADVRLHCIKLYETPRIYVEYYGE